MRPRVLIADDNAGIQSAVSELLASSCEIAGCVADTDELCDVTGKLRPDVVLLDLSLRGSMTALEVCRHITATTPEVRVVAFTAHNDDDVRAAAAKAGASGFVWKVQADELLRTIQRVVDGSSGAAAG